MTGRRSILDHNGGAGAVEFALAAPVLLAFVFATTQLGMLFFASADMRNAVGAGARLASIYPSPSDTRIINRVNESIAGLDRRHITGPTLLRGRDAAENEFVEITVTYAAPIDFILFDSPRVTLSETRRVFTQAAAN